MTPETLIDLQITLKANNLSELDKKIKNEDILN